MNRRDFFKRLGAGSAVVAAAKVPVESAAERTASFGAEDVTWSNVAGEPNLVGAADLNVADERTGKYVAVLEDATSVYRVRMEYCAPTVLVPYVTPEGAWLDHVFTRTCVMGNEVFYYCPDRVWV